MLPSGLEALRASREAHRELNHCITDDSPRYNNLYVLICEAREAKKRFLEDMEELS